MLCVVLCIHICIYIYIYIHTHTSLSLNIYIYIYIYTQKNTCSDRTPQHSRLLFSSRFGRAANIDKRTHRIIRAIVARRAPGLLPPATATKHLSLSLSISLSLSLSIYIYIYREREGSLTEVCLGLQACCLSSSPNSSTGPKRDAASQQQMYTHILYYTILYYHIL